MKNVSTQLFLMITIALWGQGQKNAWTSEMSHSHEGQKPAVEKASLGKDDHEEEGHRHGMADSHDDDHAHHEEEEPSSSVGKDKAITAASKDEGIQLSEKAVQVIGLKMTSLSGGGPRFLVPDSALVAYQAERGVYRLRNGWFKLEPVQLLSKAGVNATIVSSSLLAGDQIVVWNVPFLRTAELEAWGGSGDGHGH